MGVPPRSCVLFVVHSAKAAGAQLVALGQAESLARDHRLVIAVGHGPLRPRFAQLGELRRAPTRLPVWGASRARWTLELARVLPDAVRLAVIARQRRASVIFANSSVLVAPVLAGRLARVPVIVEVQEAPRTRAARALLRFHGRLASTVVSISSWITQALGEPRAHVVQIPVGIGLPPAIARAPRAPGAPLRLLVVGTIDALKRQDVAIAAVARLAADGLDPVLELVGPEADAGYAGLLREQVRAHRLEDRVRFLGAREDVAACMRSADVVLVPAGEVTPLVLMEAMAHGTPAVAARMGSIADVVVDGDSGLLVAPGDAGAMAAAIRRLATDRELAKRLAQGGRRRVETHCDAARSHERLRTELSRTIAGATRPRYGPTAARLSSQ